jgi:hypothetical protein
VKALERIEKRRFYSAMYLQIKQILNIHFEFNGGCSGFVVVMKSNAIFESLESISSRMMRRNRQAKKIFLCVCCFFLPTSMMSAEKMKSNNNTTHPSSSIITTLSHQKFGMKRICT